MKLHVNTFILSMFLHLTFVSHQKHSEDPLSSVLAYKLSFGPPTLYPTCPSLTGALSQRLYHILPVAHCIVLREKWSLLQRELEKKGQYFWHQFDVKYEGEKGSCFLYFRHQHNAEIKRHVII